MSAAAIEAATQIEQAVVQIRNADDPGVDCRWQERAAFMRPARIIFGAARFAPQDGISGADQAGFETSWEVVTTDLSPDGAGILSYSGNEPLPSRVTLVIDETAFDCDVR